MMGVDTQSSLLCILSGMVSTRGEDENSASAQTVNERCFERSDVELKVLVSF